MEWEGVWARLEWQQRAGVGGAGGGGEVRRRHLECRAEGLAVGAEGRGRSGYRVPGYVSGEAATIEWLRREALNAEKRKSQCRARRTTSESVMACLWWEEGDDWLLIYERFMFGVCVHRASCDLNRPLGEAGVVGQGGRGGMMAKW